jgi:hypothetical protein
MASRGRNSLFPERRDSVPPASPLRRRSRSGGNRAVEPVALSRARVERRRDGRLPHPRGKHGELKRSAVEPVAPSGVRVGGFSD